MEGRGVDEVDEGPLAGDLDNGEPLPVALLELWISRDVDLVERVAELGEEHCAGSFAEVTIGRVVENDVGHS